MDETPFSVGDRLLYLVASKQGRGLVPERVRR
jgi:hypothetical protein